MKTKIVSKILIILLVVLMLLPVFTFVVSAQNTANNNASNNTTGNTTTDNNQSTDQKNRAPGTQSAPKTKVERFREHLDKKTPITKMFTSQINEVRKCVPSIVAVFKDMGDGGHFDERACIETAITLVNNVCSYLGPYGQLAGAIVGLAFDIYKSIMGGEEPTSEVAQMEDRLNQKLDEIQNQLSDIENQINNLSNEINESTNKIISAITSAMDNAHSKTKLSEFMLASGTYDFGYNQYRNYLYGEASNNSMANTAYYDLLKESIANGASSDTVKYYYDQLYTAIMNNRDVYKDYLMGSSTDKSIVQHYYDVVSANPNLVEANTTPELMAIMFAYDLYQTELMTNQLISICNLYQYTYMYMNDVDYYEYDVSTGKRVTIADIDGAGNIDSMYQQCVIRVSEVYDQIAKDLLYILNLEDSYLVESSDGNIFEVIDSDPDTYAKLLVGQTVYLNRVPQEVCALFGFDIDDFTYRVSVPSRVDGAFTVDGHASSIQASICYKSEVIDTITFTVGTNAKFYGGDGTASNPYLIATTEQFKSIANGLDKHYRLIGNIDFNGETISPIGQRMNNNDNIVCDEFTGSLDGDGYEIKNLHILGKEYAGIFGKIGYAGEVADLKLTNIMVESKFESLATSNSNLYAGIVAGKNEGIIKYCSINSSTADSYGVSIEVENSVRNRNIYAYAGGVAGQNDNEIACCIVENIKISASSKHDFGGDAANMNQNNVFVGGICGYNRYAIKHSLVKSTTKLSSSAELVYSPANDDVYPTVGSYAGGIAAKTDSADNISNVESSAEVILNRATLTRRDSHYRKNTQNRVNKSHGYIAEGRSSEWEKIKTTLNLEEEINKNAREHLVTFECTDTVYDAGSASFNFDSLKFFVNGKEVEYEVLEIYGFDTNNKTFADVTRNLSVLFSTVIEGEKFYFAQDFTITVEENRVSSIEMTNINSCYIKDKFSPLGLIIKYNTVVGDPYYLTINSDNISQVEYSGDISTFGEQEITLKYNNDIIIFKINVVCNHGDNFTNPDSGYVYSEQKSLDPTCTAVGYKAYICSTCGDERHFYLSKVEHVPTDTSDVKSTCSAEGHTGAISCVNCGLILVEDMIIPKTNHNYVYVDENTHKCSGCGAIEHHHYTVTESVESKCNSDGSESSYIVYTHSCVCKKDGVVLVKEIVDENTIIDANAKLPTIMVSDGYALAAGDEVVVYIQLLNNPGINAANFGIRYSVGLELVDIQDGTVLAGSLVTDGNAVNYGYNFVWGDATYCSTDANLLKLTFKIPEYAKLGDSYDISLVYAIGNGAQGGFSTKEGKQYFITRGGTIKIVERLPGDINNDGVVDLMDAIEIGRFVVGKTDTIDETYANVDLSDNNDDSSNVDIIDMVTILQYLTGGYGANLLTQDFEIILNTNGYNQNLDDLLVSIYDTDNDTYKEAGLVDLERDGYKFLGWYDQMVGGNRVDINGKVKYNPNQKKQMLYAQWELNQLSFDGNGATSGEMEDVYYTTQAITLENAFKNESQVVFISDKHASENSLLKYEFLGWNAYDSNGTLIKFYDAASNKEFEEILYDFYQGNYGALTLKAVWSEAPTLNYPDWHINGYDDTIHWYGDSDYSTDEIIPGENDEYILKLTPVAGKYRVYAQLIPTVYNIYFDFSGGTGFVGGCYEYDSKMVMGVGVDNPYSLSKVNISKAGSQFDFWEIYIDDKFYTNVNIGDSIGYLPNVNANSKVVIKASWDEQTYSVYYDANNGNESNVEKTYKVSQIDNIDTMFVPIYRSYSEYNRFVGWYVDEGLTNPFDPEAIRGNPRNITLYAKWDLCTAYKISNTPQIITENRVIIDWSATPAGTYNVYSTIYLQNVSEVYFIGNPETTYSGLVIMALARTESNSDLTIHFKDFNINDGYLGKHQDSVDLNVTIYSEGKNIIHAPKNTPVIGAYKNLTLKGAGELELVAGNGTDGVNAGDNGKPGATAIKADNITIDIKGKLTVKGGNGGNGRGFENQITTRKGGAGGNGGNAIECQNITVSNTSKIELQGGNGGAGAQGGQGAQGAQGTPGSNSTHKKDAGAGGTGYQGHTGANGGNGGNGGIALKVTNRFHNESSNIKLIGGNGGKGGQGGKGGKGGTGGTGGADTHGCWFCTNAAGRGGQGGKGGTGGTGGTGGNRGNALSVGTFEGTNISSSQNGSYGSGGAAGVGGDAGDGGTGGDAGAVGSNGANGGKGTTGDPGSKGSYYPH